MIEKIRTEKEMWAKYYNNYDNLAAALLTDILAFLPEDKRQGCIDASLEILKNIKEPIDGKKFFDSAKMDIENFEKVNSESAVAYRTLEWVEGLMNTETEEKQKAEE